MFIAADKFFSRISSNKSNSTVLQDILEIEKLGELVISRLEVLEKDDEILWWEDKELIRTFDKLFQAGIVLLPNDPVDRYRWIALVCISFSEKGGFSYGNLLFSVDYLPDEMLPEREERFGVGIIEEEQQFRKKLANEGWKSLL